MCFLVLGLTSTSFASVFDNERKKNHRKWLEKVFGAELYSNDKRINEDEPYDINFAAKKAKEWLTEELGSSADEIVYIGHEDLDAPVTIGPLTRTVQGPHRHVFKFTSGDNIYIIMATYDQPDSKTWIKIGSTIVCISEGDALEVIQNGEKKPGWNIDGPGGENPSAPLNGGFVKQDPPNVKSHLPGIGRPVPDVLQRKEVQNKLNAQLESGIKIERELAGREDEILLQRKK